MIKYRIKNEKHPHYNHIVEIRETVIYAGLIKVYCNTCDKNIYINPDDLEKTDE